jgi:caffeoyl-CoA O-methyltransferase
VEIRVGDASQLLRELGSAGPFDFLFIDADKSGYNTNLDWGLENVRVGGVIAAHNAFRRGSVAGNGSMDEYTATMQAFNRRVANEPRLMSTIFPAGDGTLFAVKLA